jgi:hypothetical protein
VAKPPWNPLVIYSDDPEKILVASETIPDKWYQVFWDGQQWKCGCKDYLSKKMECKHILTYLKFLGNMEGGREPEENVEISLEHGGMITPPPSNGTAPILSKYVKQIHGRDFVQYEGLLALAHERGLIELGCAFIAVTDTLALAYAWARFCSERVFWDAADATPNNVHSQVKAHFPRVALTRAKARVLRDALNIGMVSVEELEE